MSDDDVYRLDVGAMWEIETDESRSYLREVTVFASPHGIRTSEMCGDWEITERIAIHPDADEARQVAEALLEAAKELDRNGDLWRHHVSQSDPDAELQRRMEEHIRRMERDTAPGNEAEVNAEPPSVTA